MANHGRIQGSGDWQPFGEWRSGESGCIQKSILDRTGAHIPGFPFHTSGSWVMDHW